MAIVVAYAGRKAPAEEVVTAIVEAGGKATSFQADVAEESDVAALFDAAELSYGGVDVVVNAAGIMLLSPLADLDLEVFDRMVRINLRGTFVVDREAARRRAPGRRHHQLLVVGGEDRAVRTTPHTRQQRAQLTRSR